MINGLRARLNVLFSGRYGTIKIVFAAFVFACLRSPLLLMRGRFFAEEGTVYFQDAWNLPLWEALFAPHLGYYSLLDNAVAAVAAHLVPLSWAAFVFTFTALMIFVLLAYLAATCELWETPEARMWAALLCVISPSVEVWLNLEDSQFCLAACVAVVLLSDSRRHQAVRSLTLLLAGLTGPVSCSLAPFAWWRAYRSRNMSAVWQASLLTICGGIQALFLLHAIHGGQRGIAGSSKLLWIGPIFLVKIICTTFGTRLSFFLLVRLLETHLSAALFWLCWLLGAASLVALGYLARLARPVGFLMLCMAIYSFVFAFAGSGEPANVVIGGANRYFFLSALLVWLLILVAWQRTRDDEHGRRFAKFSLVLITFAGLLDSAGYWKRNQVDLSPWRPQVAAWRKNSSVPIRISPATWGPRIILNPR